MRVVRAVLIEEITGRPSQSVAEDTQRTEVDTDALIAHHSGGFAEHDAGLVNGKDMPDRAGAEPGIGERPHPAQRHGLGMGESGGVDDRADQRGDPVGFELCDGRCGEGFGCHGSHSARWRRDITA